MPSQRSTIGMWVCRWTIPSRLKRTPRAPTPDVKTTELHNNGCRRHSILLISRTEPTPEEEQEEEAAAEAAEENADEAEEEAKE